MKQIFLFIAMLVCLSSGELLGQQESHFTNFMHNYLLLNPGYAGAREVPSFTALYRNQWMGFEGAPVSQLLSFNTPFFNKKVGFGATVFHRSAGITQAWSGTIAYSYQLQLSKDFSVRMGLQGSARYLGFDFNDPDVVLRDFFDPSTAAAGEVNKYTGNFGAGFFATYKEFYFGASVPGLFTNEIGVNNDTEVTAEVLPHFYGMAGVLFPVSDKVQLRPALLVKYVNNAPVDFDINLSTIFDNNVSLGFSYRTGGSGFGESIDLLFYYQINASFGIGMAYDVSISDIARYQSGSFEALARYDIRTNRADLSNPRFF